MSTRDVLAIGGAVIGFAIGGPQGAQLGFMAGSIIGGVVDPPPGLNIADLSAPQINGGTAMFRGYGYFPAVGNPIWISEARATESGGGKGAPSGGTTVTYTRDVIYQLCDNVDVLAVVKIFVNKKLEYTAHADSDTASLAASAQSEAWESFELADGNPAQMPWSVYEDVEGVGNAEAHRGFTTLRVRGLVCGSSPALPLLETELITAGTPAEVTETESGYVCYGVIRTGTGVSDPDIQPVPDGVAAPDPGPGQIWDTRTIAWDVDPDLTIKELGRISLCDYNGVTPDTFDNCTYTEPVANSWDVTCRYIPGNNYLSNNNNVLLLGYVEQSSYTTWAPADVTLKSVVDAELAKNPAIDLDDWDTTDLAGTPVHGFKAVGTTAAALQELGDIYYFDLVPDAPNRFVLRGNAVVATLTNVEAGMAVGGPGEVFTGPEDDPDEEQPAVTGLAFLNYDNLQMPGFERSDRVATETPDITKVRTNVVLTPEEGKGRAIARNMLKKADASNFEFTASEQYIRLQPGDAVTVPDDEGNSFNVFLRSISDADGIRNCRGTLYDTTAIIYTGIAAGEYTPPLTVVAPVDTTLVAIDGPILQDADDGFGAYTAVEGSTDGVYPGSQVRRSVDGATFDEVAATHTTASVIGQVTVAPTSFRLNRWDRHATITVDVGATGQTLASSTEAAMQANRTLNSAFVGVHGRWVVIRWVTATLLSEGVYRLSVLQFGRRGTESHVASIQAGDTFVQASTALRRMPGNVVDLNQLRYLKGVTNGRSIASADAQEFTNTGVGRKPFSPGRIVKALDGSSNATFTVSRRPRTLPRYGGVGGSYIPQPEDTLRFEIDVYADDTFATVVRTLASNVGDNTLAYSAAQQTADGFTPGQALAIRGYQLSAQVGRGHYKELEAA